MICFEVIDNALISDASSLLASASYWKLEKLRDKWLSNGKSLSSSSNLGIAWNVLIKISFKLS